MSNTQITAHIKDQALQLTNIPKLASGSEGVLQIVCNFDALWDGYGKTGVFYRDAKEVYHVPLTANVVTVPHEVLTDEGSFLFGIMGVSTNTRTTEVVRINLAQGAITRPTADAQEPTPDIYKQLLQAYGVTEKRVDEIIAMRGAGYQETVLSDEYISGTLRSNGADVFISFTISKMSLMGGGWHYTDYCIPPALAPLCSVDLRATNGDINVTLEEPNAEGWARLLIENVGEATLTTDMVTNVSGIYPLRSVFVAEVADLRVGYDGTAHGTAGTAIRSQISELRAYINNMVVHGAPPATIGYATLLASKWVGDKAPYSQVVSIAGVTEYSQVDLTPSVEQLTVFHHKDLAFVTENDGGVVTVYAIGEKPLNDYTMQVTITEVRV